MKSKRARTVFRKSRIRSEANNSEGLGGIGPEGQNVEIGNAGVDEQALDVDLAGQVVDQSDPVRHFEDFVHARPPQIGIEHQDTAAQLGEDHAQITGGCGLALSRLSRGHRHQLELVSA